METHPGLPLESWDQTPPEVQAYIRALEARVATLEGMMQALQEQLLLSQAKLESCMRDQWERRCERWYPCQRFPVAS